MAGSCVCVLPYILDFESIIAHLRVAGLVGRYISVAKEMMLQIVSSGGLIHSFV